MFVGSLSPLSVTSVPPVIVTEPLTPDWVAVQVLCMLVASKFSLPEALMFWMLVALVTEPLGPSEPDVVTMSEPELKTVAGPADALADAALAVCGLLEALDASVTVGVGPGGLQVNMLKTVTVH
jgi:hypothetical protein